MTRDLDSLQSPYRPVRPIDANAGPWPGMLTCLPSGERRVLVDSEAVGADWPGWRSRPDGHVVAAHDLVRRPDGHDIVMEVCVGALTAFIARREAERSPLSPGEAVTLGVSVLRGCAELREAAHVTGEWWLTEHGRPVFAAGAGSRPLHDASAAILAEVARTTALPAAWAQASAVLTATRSIADDYIRAEAVLFSVAAPAPLQRVGAVHPNPRRIVAWAEDPGAAVAPRNPPLWQSLARHVDADLGDLLSRTATEFWRRIRAMKRRRAAPAIVGLVAASAVAGLGLWWPGEVGEPAATTATRDHSAAASPPAGVSPSATTTQPPAPPPAVGPEDENAEGLDLATIAEALLDSLHACGGDGACRVQFTSAGSDGWDAGAASLGPSQRVVTLVDDFGGMAVLRVEAESGAEPSQFIVIGRHDEGWLLRGVHDAGQQPS